MRIIHPCSLLLLVTFLAGPSASKAQPKQAPNIIYIYADDLGYGELGVYGQQKIRTPHLDKLAQEGIRFTQHYSSAPVCAPSRCMLLTGQHPGHAYIRGNYELGGYEDSTEGGQMPLYRGAFTLANLLKKKGYQTAMIGKWGLGVAGTTGSPLLQGFDYYYGYLDQKQAHNYYPSHLWENDRWDTLDNPTIQVHRSINRLTATDSDFNSFIGRTYAPSKMTEKALQYIEQNQQKPFFLYLPYTLPHLALQVPPEYLKKYLGQFEETPYYGEKGYVPCKYPRATYAAMISFLDDQVGIILDKIQKMGLDKNTVVFFSSDNGTSFSAGVDYEFFNSVAGLRGLKMEVYEGGIRVPFIARWPGRIKPNSVTDHVSVQYDMMATLDELTGGTNAETDGISMLPTLLGNKKQPQHPFLYFEYPENGGQIAVRIGPWKGVRKNLKANRSAAWELYDLQQDPYEKTNLAGSKGEIIQQMEAIVRQEHQHAHLAEWEILHPKTSNSNPIKK